ncbi:hypothetical protein ACIG87_31075 [Micromonospora sp. NPDC051925]|uniref:hypothetical protein n=1 Tax=Micromonospora sp. NPDC051925 TaxID=3364288 RepID=UPI0037C6CECF
MTNLEGNAVLVNVLSSAIRSTVNGMETAPALIRRTLEEGAWRRFVTPRGEEVEHNSIESFITAAPTSGLGRSIPDLVRVIGDDGDALGLLARELGVPIDDLAKSANGGPWQSHIDRDALEFGEYARTGGWLFGLMVARSVAPKVSENRKRRGLPGAGAGSSKVSASEFALKAGCSKNRVMRFYRAWVRAAAAGLVPSADSLVPGEKVALPDPEAWSEYFVSYEQGSPRRESIARQAQLEGISYGQAVRIAEHPGALRTAILGDGKTAEAACLALLDRAEDDANIQTLVAQAIASIPEVKKAVSIEARKFEQADYVEQVVREGVARTPGGEMVKLPHSAMERIAEALAEVGDPKADPESAKAAYAVVQDAVSIVVEEDPETLARERKAKLRKVLSATAKSIDLLGGEDLLSAADDEMRESILSLQRKLNELAVQLAKSSPKRLRAV